MWSVQWARSPVVKESKSLEEAEKLEGVADLERKENENVIFCRGCRMDFVGKHYGEKSNRARIRLMCSSVRETEAGVYCAECFSHLPPCPVCGVNPTSHAEYPCVTCEIRWVSNACTASGGREASPTYRGWSTVYAGKGQNNGMYSRRKYAKD